MSAIDEVERKREEELEAQRQLDKEAEQNAIATTNRIEQIKTQTAIEKSTEGTREYYENLRTLQDLEFQSELSTLQFQYEQKLISEEEFQAEKDRITLEHSKKRSEIDLSEKEYVLKTAQDLISKYDDFVSSAMEAELEAVGNNEEKQNKIRKKYAKAKFLGQIASIGISTAQAIMATWAAFAEVPVAAAIQSALITATGIAQTIKAKSEMDNALQMKNGGLLVGNSHADGGIPVGNTGIEVEGNEYVVNKVATKKFLPLLETLNSYNGYSAPTTGSVVGSNGMGGGLVDRETIQAIVSETVSGVSSIPVIVSQYSITKAQRNASVIENQSLL